MRQLSVEGILRYATKNTRGNILINELPDDHGEYIIHPTDYYLQPRRLLLFCEELSKQDIKSSNLRPFLSFKDIVVPNG